MSKDKPRKADINYYHCETGGFELACMVNGHRLSQRYIGYTINQAKERFYLECVNIWRNGKNA